MQRSYFLDRDIDKALRRMALEEGRNLTETVNNALRKGLGKYITERDGDTLNKR